MADPQSVDTLKRTLPDHDRCDTHRGYKLGCEQYERLLARSGQLCEICQRSAQEASTHKLFIDHNGPKWAVRGLLCNSCNTQLRNGSGWLPGSAEYLRRTWWLAECERLEVPSRISPEPPIGSAIRDQFGATWIRQLTGEWRAHQGGRNEAEMTWERIHELRGPHNMAPFDVFGPDGRQSERWEVERIRKIRETCVEEARDELLDEGRHGYAHSILAKLDGFDRALYEARAREAAGDYEPSVEELERCQAALAVDGLMAERGRLWDIVMGFLHAMPDGEENWKRAVKSLDARLGQHAPTDVMEEALFSSLTEDERAAAEV